MGFSFSVRSSNLYSIFDSLAFKACARRLRSLLVRSMKPTGKNSGKTNGNMGKGGGQGREPPQGPFPVDSDMLVSYTLWSGILPRRTGDGPGLLHMRLVGHGGPTLLTILSRVRRSASPSRP